MTVICNLPIYIQIKLQTCQHHKYQRMSSRCGFKHHLQRSYFTTTSTSAALCLHQTFPGAKCPHYPSSKTTGKYRNTLISQRKQNSLNLGACSYATTYIIMTGLAKEKTNPTTVNEHRKSHETKRYVETGAPGTGKQASLYRVVLSVFDGRN